MGEVTHEVKTILVDMLCEECGEGYMRPVGNIVLTTYPIQYPHRCEKCGYTKVYTKMYPYETYEYYTADKEVSGGFTADEWYRQEFMGK